MHLTLIVIITYYSHITVNKMNVPSGFVVHDPIKPLNFTWRQTNHVLIFAHHHFKEVI